VKSSLPPERPIRSLERVLNQQAGDDIGVDIGGRAAVLKVTIALELHGQRDADRRAAVGNTC